MIKENKKPMSRRKTPVKKTVRKKSSDEFSKSLDILARLINKKLETSAEDIEELSINEIIRMMTNLSKAIIEKQKLDTLTSEDAPEIHENDNIRKIINTISHDPEASEMAKNLLKRISKINAGG